MSNENEGEIICSACGFSSDFVPEGMITCSRCFAVYYCSKECRDWEYSSGGHDKVCQPVTLSSVPAKASQTGKSDGLLGDSFNNSDGGSTSHASIDVLNLFEKQRSPFFSTNKFLQSSAAKTKAAAPKTLPDPSSQSNLYIPASPHSGSHSHSNSSNSKQLSSNKESTGTLGTFLEATSPDRTAKAAVTSMFQISQSNNEESDDDDEDNDQNVNRKNFIKLYMSQHSDNAEDESMGMSALKDESAADLTAIAEESNVMSGPVVEASWRRRNSTISAGLSTGTGYESTLDMNDSEIIGATTTYLMCGMNATTESLAESLASLNSNQDTHENSAVLNLLSVCTSLQSESLGQLDEQELDYSEGTDSNPNHQSDSSMNELKEQPEVVESSNSTETSDLRVSVVETLGHPFPIQRGPSLRGFREAYNECDTASLHSRSLARSSSSSDNSLSSHGENIEKLSELPERLNRSSASLKDFRDIYNADLDKALLPHHHSCSSLCSSSIGFDDHPPEVSIKTPSDIDKDDLVVDLNPPKDSNSGQKRKDLSSQLRSLSSEQSKTNPSQTIVGQRQLQRSPSSRSGDSALQIARLRNESLKDSLNSALRVYEQLYGEEAAKDVFFQLTSKVEPTPAKQEQPSGEQTFDWKRSRSSTKDTSNANSSLLRNDKSVPNAGVNASASMPRYMKYRTSLSATSLSESQIHQDENKDEVSLDAVNCEPPTNAGRTLMDPVRTSSYSQYRSKLSAETVISSEVEIVENERTVFTETKEASKDGNIASLSMDDNEVPVRALTSKSRYESYRTSLSNLSIESRKVPGRIDASTSGNDDTEIAHALGNAPVQKNLISADIAANNDENENSLAECDVLTSSNGLRAATQPSERSSGYLKYRQMLGKIDSEDTLVPNSLPDNMKERDQPGASDYSRVEKKSTLTIESGAIPDTSSEKIDENYAETAPKQRYIQYRSSLQNLMSADCPENNLEAVSNPSNKGAVDGTARYIDLENAVTSMQLPSEEQTAPRYMQYRASLVQNDGHDHQAYSQGNAIPFSEPASIDCKVVEDRRSPGDPVDQPRKNVGRVSSLIRDMERYELKTHGVSPSMCSMANTEDLLKVWNEVESDRKQLYLQRFATSMESPKPQVMGAITPCDTRDELNLVDNEDYMDIETGKLLAPSSLGCNEDAMKMRAKKHQTKQRSWCGFLIFVLVTLPLAIGLGIGLTGSEPTIERKPVIVQTPIASPTAGFTLKPVYDQNQGMTYSPIISPTRNGPDMTLMPVTSTPVAQPTSAPFASTQQPTKRPSLLPVASPVSSLPTASPIATNETQSPTTYQPEKSVELYNILFNVSSDDGAAIKSSGSPQSLAFQWLAATPDLLLDYSDARIIQRYALATLYFSTDGPRWLDNIGWLSEANECLWYTMTSQQNCDDESMYLNLNLGSNDLAGVIPNELTLLTRLQSLTLSGGPARFLGGVIPSALGTMTRLTVLDLQQNSLFGGIPSALCDLGGLEVLDLSLNRFTRAIPSDLGRLTSLKSLNLAMNDLTGVIPTSIQSLTQLQKISIGNNNLVGQVAVGTSLGALTDFNVENNRFTSIGTEIGLLTSLQTLTIYDNDVIGTLPTQIGNLTTLQRLDLHKNGLTGSIPTEVGALVRLGNLDLSLNNFTSTIPTEFGLLTSLATLNLQSNLLEGPIPNELGKLSATSVIKINDNNIIGEVSQELCDQFGFITPIFYADCLEQSDGTTKLACSDSCCTFCCNEESGCVCGLQGTTFEVFCNM